MQRRSIIKSRPLRRSLLVFGVVSLAVAIVGCSMRIAVLWQVDDGQSTDARDVVLMHGTLAWRTSQHQSRGSPSTAPILNWQIEPGLAAATYVREQIVIAMNPGPLVVTTRTVASSMPLALLCIACLVLAVPWLPRRRGFCDCGHDLTGLRSDRCPECGKPIVAAGT